MNATDLLNALDMVVFERQKNSSFRLLGTAPEWFRRLYSGDIFSQSSLGAGTTFAFLKNFLFDAEVFWRQSAPTGQLASGSWCETDAEGQECHLEAIATCLGKRQLLFLQHLGATYAAQQALLQQARETTLDYQHLQRTEAALRQSETRLADMLQQLETHHADLLAILNQLHLGTVMLDAQGWVTFLSQTCQRFFGKSHQEVVGKPWAQVSPFSAATQAQLQAMAQRLPQQRQRLSVHLDAANTQHYWMEVEIHDDPRQPRGKSWCSTT